MCPLTPEFLLRDWYFIAEQPTPAPHLAHPEGCAAIRVVPAQVSELRVALPQCSRNGWTCCGALSEARLPTDALPTQLTPYPMTNEALSAVNRRRLNCKCRDCSAVGPQGIVLPWVPKSRASLNPSFHLTVIQEGAMRCEPQTLNPKP